MSLKSGYILSAAALLGLLLLLAIRNTSYSKGHDSYEYAMMGINLWNGDGILFRNRPDVVLSPGFPLAVGLIAQIVNDPEWSGKIVCIIAFFASLFIFHRIALFYLKAFTYAVLAVVLFATNSNVLTNASSGYSEMLFTAVLLFLVWIHVGLRDCCAVLGHVVIFAVAWAWLYYIRPEGLVAGGIVYLWYMSDRRKDIKTLLLIPIIFFILICPYLFFLKQHTGHWQLSGKTYLNLVMGESESPYQQEINSKTTDKRYTIIEKTLEDPSLSLGFLGYIKEKGLDFVHRIPKNIWKLFKVYWYSFSIIGITLILFGFVKMNRGESLLLLSLLSPLAVLVLFFILGRTVAVYHWVTFVFLVNGLKELERVMSRRWNERYAGFWIKVIFIGITLYQMRSVVKSIYLA